MWSRDVARAGIVTVLYTVAVVAVLPMVAYGGVLGGALLYLAVFLGPFAAAWIAARILPSAPRLVMHLALGAFAGVVLYVATGGAFGPRFDQLRENGQAWLALRVWLFGVFLGALGGARWNRRALNAEG